MELLYKNNQAANFIKQLLATSPLPIYDTVRLGDYVVENTTYVFRDRIYEVLPGGSGMFGYGDEFLFQGPLTPRSELVDVNNIYVVRDNSGEQYPLYPTSEVDWSYYRRAPKLKLKGTYTWGEAKRNLTHVYKSTVSYYDADTHKHLGEYLRCLRDIEDLNLMSMYNCYAGDSSLQFYLGQDKLVRKQLDHQTTKIYFVPVKFNRVYTIGFNCSQRFKVLPVLLSGGAPVTRLNAALQPEQISLQFTTARFNSCNYNNPVLYSTGCIHSEHQLYEKYLYLAIEVPVSNDSPLVVLEGDYRQQCPTICSIKEYVKQNTSDGLTTIPSLLRPTDSKQHVIADKLLSYLLDYTIDSRELIADNVRRVEKEIGLKYDTDSVKNPGLWSKQLQYTLYYKYNMIKDRYDMSGYDIFGYVDRDIDNAIKKGRIKYGGDFTK